MKKMLSECEHDIKLIKKKIKQLKKQPFSARCDFEIVKWEEMLGDVMYRTGCIKELMSREGGEKSVNSNQQSFEDLLNPKPVHQCEGCDFFVDGKCTYPFSRTDYCISGSKKTVK